MQKTSQKNRNIMSGLAIVIGLLMVSIIPFIVQTSLGRVLVGLIAHIEAGNPTFSSGVPLFDFFYPVWRAVIFVAGAALIIISQEIKKGEEWTYPLAVSLFALPAIGGMFMFLPYVNWVEGFPLPMIISLIGLTGFWSFIFLRQAEKMQKWARFGALTFIGMLSTHAFTIGIGAQRTMATRPGYPMYKDFTWWIFNWVGEVNWVAVILLFMSIPLLAVGKRRGWWLAVIGAIAILMIDLPTDFIVYATVLTLIVFLLFRIPGIWNTLNLTRKDDDVAGMGAGVAMIVGGSATLTVQYWAGLSHMIEGINYADVWHVQLNILGWLAVLPGAALLLANLLEISIRPLQRSSSRGPTPLTLLRRVK